MNPPNRVNPKTVRRYRDLKEALEAKEVIMSGFTLRKFRKFAGHRTFQILVYGIVGFAMVFFFAQSPWGGGGQRSQEIANAGEVVATVNGETITAGELEKLLHSQRERNLLGSPREELQQELQQRWSALQQMIQAKIFLQAAKQQGMLASGREIEAAKQEYLDLQVAALRMRLLPQGKGTERDLDRILQERAGKSLDQLKEELLAEQTEEAYLLQATQKKWEQALKGRNMPSEETLRRSFDHLKPARIAIAIEKRSKEQARKRAEEIYAKLQNGMKFEEAVRQYSEDPQLIKERGGALEEKPAPSQGVQWMLTSQLKPEQVAQVMNLPKGQWTPPLESRDGKSFYIYKMVERQPKLPADFEKEKRKYAEQLAEQRAQEEIGKVLEQVRETTKTEVKEPLLRLYQKRMEAFRQPGAEQLKLYKELLPQLEKLIAKPAPTTRLAHWLYIDLLREITRIVKDPKQKKEYSEKLLVALNRFFRESGDSAELRIELAKLLIERQEKEQAVKHLEIASGLAYAPRLFPLHYQIAELYKKVGRKDLASREEERAKAMIKEFSAQWRAQQQMMQARQQAEPPKKQTAAQARPAKQAQKPTSAQARGTNPASPQPAPAARPGGSAK